VTVEEALTAYTHGSAYAVGREADLGRITPGRLADFVALSDDILAIDPAGIRDLHVTATVIGGEVVFEHGEDDSMPSRSTSS
jgi:predicted amidohydrolase YtcJ